MKYPIYQVDAFTDRPFAGNPAGVMPLKTWLPDQLLQSIAAEMNLAETAFFVPNQGGYHLRWFTPSSFQRMFANAGVAIDSFGPLVRVSKPRRLLFGLLGPRFAHLSCSQMNVHGHRLG